MDENTVNESNMSNEMTGKFCAFKNQIPTDKLNMGMGDIFIKMAR